MSLPVAAFIVLLLLVAWLFVRTRQSGEDTKKPAVPRVSQQSTAYHAVSIKFSSNACKAARDLQGRRFLSNAAPRLPLPECDELECNCRFIHHKDRRTGKDRRSPFGPRGFGSGTGSYEAEQRKGRDRRHDDDDDLF